jgi:hypothetical protein
MEREMQRALTTAGGTDEHSYAVHDQAGGFEGGGL